jgi:threonine dehydratase
MFSPTYEDVALAAIRIEGNATRTPVLTSRTVDETLSAQVFFKCENFQRSGAFKFRGAFNALSYFDEQQRKAGVVTFSSGNHAQAIALSSQILGIPCTILMPTDAPTNKIAATKSYGGNIVFYDRYQDDREKIGNHLALEQGKTFSVLAARAISPRTKVYGVEPEAGNDGQQSFRSGSIVRIDIPRTIADSAQLQQLGNYTFEIINRDVDDIFTATDGQLVDCMRFFASRMKIMVEPTGCLGFAAVQQLADRLKSQRIGVIVSGGNVDLDRFCALVGS